MATSKAKPSYKGSFMTKKEANKDMKEFNKRPGEMAKLKAIKKKNNDMMK